jgi:hypothetical protein
VTTISAGNSKPWWHHAPDTVDQHRSPLHFNGCRRVAHLLSMFWIDFSADPIGRHVGPEAMKFGGWQRLNAEYAKQFGIETPNWPPLTAQK